MVWLPEGEENLMACLAVRDVTDGRRTDRHLVTAYSLLCIHIAW